MKKTILSFVFISISIILLAQNNVGVGTNTPNQYAKLDISATDKGLLIPRLTTALRTTLTGSLGNSEQGLLVFDTDLQKFFYWDKNLGMTGNWNEVRPGSLSDGKIWIGNASNVAVEQTVSGDATITNLGVLDLTNNAVETSEINNNAVDGTKINISGNSSGSLMYYDGLDWSNIAPGTTGQILQSSGAGAPFWVNKTSILNTQNGLSTVTSGGSANPTTPYAELGGSLYKNTTIAQGANSLALTSTITNAFSVDNSTFSVDAANHRVGIGTFNPNYLLEVNGQATDGIVKIKSINTSAYLYIDRPNTSQKNYLGFQTGGVDNWILGQYNTNNYRIIDWTNGGNSNNAFTILQGGTNNVGIGTATPDNKLTIDAAATTAATTNSYPFAIRRAGTTELTMGSDASFGYLQTWNSKPLLINGQGNNVGINMTTAPNASLEIGGTPNNAFRTAYFNISANNQPTTDRPYFRGLGNHLVIAPGTSAGASTMYYSYPGDLVAGNTVTTRIQESVIISATGSGGSGTVTIPNLAGTGNRIVTANSSGTLETKENSMWAVSSNMGSSPDDLAGGDLTTDGHDDNSYVRNLGFTVVINGVSYTQVTVCTNGWIAFGNVGSTTFSAAPLPLNFTTNPVIMPYMTDLKDFGSGEWIREYPMNDVYITEWRMRAYTTGATNWVVRFQVQIHKSGLINVKYYDPMQAQLNGQAHTIDGLSRNTVIGFQTDGGASARFHQITYNAKVMDDNNEISEGWSVCPVR